MKANAWLITAKSNLHVGNENTSSFGLIDKAIQRDALTGLPCINSSSLKGALNEFCSVIAGLSPVDRINIFGVDKMSKSTSTQKGSHIFFDANILLLPVQEKNKLFKLVTTDSILENYVNKFNLFNSEERIKNVEAFLTSLKNMFNTATLEVLKDGTNETADKKFSDLCSDEELPIIARNCLEDGRSTNLWYEQILPAETVFYTFISAETDLISNALDKSIVQIGANATIGYGYCLFNKMG